MPEVYRIEVDGVTFELVRNETLEAEVTELVKGIPDEELTVRFVDDKPAPLRLADLVNMGATHTTAPEIIACPRCGSQDTMKYGIESGQQQYICSVCRRKFNTKQAPFHMRTPARQVGAALAMFYDGLSVADVARHFEQNGGEEVNASSVYRWIQKYSQVAVDLTKGYKAHTGKIWAADETVIGVRAAQTKIDSPNTVWYWDVIDEDTKFLLASHMSNTRTIRDAEALFTQARGRASTSPRFIITDKLAAYLDGIERVFGGDVVHVQSEGLASATNNNVIERFHGTIKERTKVMRDLKSRESAALLLDGWLVHYNFFRPHMSLGGRTPAAAAGIQASVTTWADVVRASP